MAVVKANAYGHGILEVAQVIENSVDFFGVVCLFEARQLRKRGVKKPILILNYTDKDSVEEAIKLDCRITVIDKQIVDTIDRIASRKKKKVSVHVKVDTGMYRLGCSPEEALDLIAHIDTLKHVVCEGVFTHFATSDERDLSFTQTQLMTFQNLLSDLENNNLRPPFVHCANSAATLRMSETHYNLVRPGKITYGVVPSDEFLIPFTPKPVLSLKTQVVQVREIEKGESVGYGRTFIAMKKTKMATLPVGYGDGFRRSPSSFGEVLVGGKRALVIGRVSMDQTTIDISDVRNVSVGDEVVIIGKQGKEMITAEDVATKLGTISSEVISSIQERVTRVVV